MIDDLLDEELGPGRRVGETGALDREQFVGRFARHLARREDLAPEPGDVHRRDPAAVDHRRDDCAAPVDLKRHYPTLFDALPPLPAAFCETEKWAANFARP